MKILTNLKNGRTYGIELIERNYPAFEGKYNAYVEVYGSFTGDFMGLVETPLKMDVTPLELPVLANMLEEFISVSHNISNWN